MSQKEDTVYVTYSLLDIIIHALDVTMFFALDCPYCKALALRDHATEACVRVHKLRRGLEWTVCVDENRG